MNGYICFYERARWECYAESSYAAQQKAVAHFNPAKSKRHMVSVVLAEKGGETVTHNPNMLPGS